MQISQPAVLCVHGDATNRADWERMLGSRKGAALISDPPYCLLTRRRKDGRERDPKNRKNEGGPVRRFEDVREFRLFMRQWLSIAVEYLALDAPIVLWMNLLGRQPTQDVCRELGFLHVRGEFVWGKRTREANSGEEILRVVETALVFTRHPATPQQAADRALPWAVVAGYDDDGQASRWGNHPNHKPFSVLEPLLRTWSRPGDLIIDPFAGSGSIPAAARQLERQVACMELEKEWVARVNERLRNPAPVDDANPSAAPQ